MEFDWFITDIDGTLLDNENNLPAINREALLHCRNIGVPVVLATGRRWTTLERLLDRLPLNGLADYAILNNGMVVKELKTRTVLYREDFPLESTLEVVKALAPLNLDPIALTYRPNGGPDVFHRRLSLMNGDFVAKNMEYSQLLEDYNELHDKSLVELILLGPESALAEAQKTLQDLPLETALIRNTFYAGYMLEITPLHISKLSGARYLAGVVGSSLERAVGIGDSANDLPLLRAVGKSFAVNTAPAEVRESVHEVVSSGQNGGVAEAIFRHFPCD